MRDSRHTKAMHDTSKNTLQTSLSAPSSVCIQAMCRCQNIQQPLAFAYGQGRSPHPKKAWTTLKKQHACATSISQTESARHPPTYSIRTVAYLYSYDSLSIGTHQPYHTAKLVHFVPETCHLSCCADTPMSLCARVQHIKQCPPHYHFTTVGTISCETGTSCCVT
jgi:hypothetical protein